MSDPASNYLPTLQEVRDDLALSVSETTRCRQCAADLKALPETARFCPCCGSELCPDRPCGRVTGRGAADSPAVFVGGQWRRCDGISGDLQCISAAVPLGPSLILEGYANALYKLGRRHETALGAAHNPQEAERCYRKAARLGNFWALARLAARWFA